MKAGNETPTCARALTVLLRYFPDDCAFRRLTLSSECSNPWVTYNRLPERGGKKVLRKPSWTFWPCARLSILFTWGLVTRFVIHHQSHGRWKRKLAVWRFATAVSTAHFTPNGIERGREIHRINRSATVAHAASGIATGSTRHLSAGAAEQQQHRNSAAWEARPWEK